MYKFALALGIVVGATLNAQAHFIFLELPPNEPAVAHMRLAEEPLEASNAGLQEKCAPMTVKTVDGIPVEFAPGENAMYATVSEETSTLLGSLDYGIMDRQGVYLLVYHAKAVRTPELAGQTNGLPVEADRSKRRQSHRDRPGPGQARRGRRAGGQPPHRRGTGQSHDGRRR